MGAAPLGAAPMPAVAPHQIVQRLGRVTRKKPPPLNAFGPPQAAPQVNLFGQQPAAAPINPLGQPQERAPLATADDAPDAAAWMASAADARRACTLYPAKFAKHVSAMKKQSTPFCRAAFSVFTRSAKSSSCVTRALDSRSATRAISPSTVFQSAFSARVPEPRAGPHWRSTTARAAGRAARLTSRSLREAGHLLQPLQLRLELHEQLGIIGALLLDERHGPRPRDI